MRKKAKIPRKYSGRRSVAFWDRLNALPPEEQKRLYFCGVMLQDIEQKVLGWIEAAEWKAWTAS